MVEPAQTTTRATTLARVLSDLLERIVKHVREGSNKMSNEKFCWDDNVFPFNEI
jgi:hypothetical protein